MGKLVCPYRESAQGIQENSLPLQGNSCQNGRAVAPRPLPRDQFLHAALAKVTNYSSLISHYSLLTSPCGISLSVMEHFHFAAPRPRTRKAQRPHRSRCLAPRGRNQIPSPPQKKTMTEARDLAAKIFGKYFSRDVFDLLKADWNRYGLQITKGDTLAQKLIVPLKKG